MSKEIIIIDKLNISDKSKKIIKAALRLIIKILIILLVIFLVTTFIFGIHRLEGNTMYPALKDGDLCITYKLEDYHAKDIVVYKVNNELKFGRIIACEGDTLDGDDEGILLNNSHIEEEVFYPTVITNTNLTLPITLNKDEFIILNDYREDINDSRTYGIITKDMIDSKVIFILRRRGL